MMVDQVLDPGATPFGRLALLGGTFGRFLMAVIGDQGPKGLRAQRRFRRSHLRGRGLVVLAMQQVAAERAEQAVVGGDGGVAVFGFAGQGAQQVGAAHNADQPVVQNHGNALDAVDRQQAGDLGDLRVGRHGDDRAGHHVPGTVAGTFEAGEIVGVQALALGDQGEPPVAPARARVVLAPDDVAFADHADRATGLVDHGCRADAALEQDAGDLAHRGFGRHGRDLPRHHVTGTLHGAAAPVQAPPSTRSITVRAWRV